jgi:hypothetical protein
MANQYWFKPKRYGYGATPITWEGWAVSTAAAAAVLGSIIVMNTLADPRNPAVWLVWAAFVAGITVWYVRLCRRRTEGEWRWRWGRRANERFGRS